MSQLLAHANALPADVLPELTESSSLTLLSGSVPILATPVAVAAGVTAAVTAAGVGFVVEEANDN